MLFSADENGFVCIYTLLVLRTPSSTRYISLFNLVRHDISWHIWAVARRLVVSLCGQQCTRYRPYYATTRIRPTLLIMVAVKSFTDRSRPLTLQPTQIGFRFIRPLCVRPAANHESYGQRVSIYKVGGGLHSLHEAGDDAIHWLESTVATALAKWNELVLLCILINHSTTNLVKQYSINWRLIYLLLLVNYLIIIGQLTTRRWPSV